MTGYAAYAGQSVYRMVEEFKDGTTLSTVWTRAELGRKARTVADRDAVAMRAARANWPTGHGTRLAYSVSEVTVPSDYPRAAVRYRHIGGE